MHKTYLIELLQKLSSKQMKELGEFVHSPFFNKNESVTRLFDYLRVQHPEFKEENIYKELIHKKVFLSAEYNDGFMRMIIFKLAALTEEYLAYTDFKAKGYDESMHIINSLLDFNLDNEAQKHINQVEKKLNASSDGEREYYKNKYSLERFKDIIYSRSYRPVTIKDKPDESLLEESNSLTSFFLISSLQRYRYLLNKTFTVNSQFELDFLPYILKFLEGEGKKYFEVNMISLLYRQIKLLQDTENEELLDELIAELTNDKLSLDEEELRDGLTVLCNICIEKGYEGKRKYYEALFNMNKYLISKDMYNRVKGGYFDNEMFLNLVTVGLMLAEISWTKDFIEKHYKLLPPDIHLNTYNYCLSKLYFKTGDFTKALESIAKVAYSDMQMKINVRITTLTIHYELGNIEEVLMQTENFKKYVQNDKLLSAGHKRIASNFIRFISALCKAKYSTKPNFDQLKQNILSADQVSNRLWLLKKTEQLEALRN